MDVATPARTHSRRLTSASAFIWTSPPRKSTAKLALRTCCDLLCRTDLAKLHKAWAARLAPIIKQAIPEAN